MTTPAKEGPAKGTEGKPRCGRGGCDGAMIYEDDEYGSLADGGSYEIYRCDKCGRRVYVELPD